MALRFRKSIKLAPGIRWNLSTSGSSFSFGPRGASVSVGKRGTYVNAGIPGTGLSSRQRLGGTPAPRSSSVATTTRVSMSCGVREDGTLYFEDEVGAPVPEHLIELAKKQNKEAILGLIERTCDEINEQVEALGRLHHDTPDCRRPPRFVPTPFDEPPPVAPVEQKPGFIAGLFKSSRERVEQANYAVRQAYERALAAWKTRKDAHECGQARQRELIEKEILSNTAAMEGFLGEILQSIAWPRETNVSFEIHDSGLKVLLDVDLPEIEDMPTKLASVPARGLKLSVKEMTATKVQKFYLEHVHGIMFRLIGETFAALPTAHTVIASGFSQRTNSATGHLQDDYLLSVRIERSKWEAMDFTQLPAIDVVEALARYDIVRSIQRSGKLQSVVPLSG